MTEVVLRVSVVHSPAAREVHEWTLLLAPGSTVHDAVRASGLAAVCPTLVVGEAELGIWGRRTSLGQRLRDGDRVEIYRPLQVDPKLARRERFRRQGSRGAGLFADRTAGRKAGY